MYRYKKLSGMIKKFKAGLEEEEKIYKKITGLGTKGYTSSQTNHVKNPHGRGVSSNKNRK